MVRSIGAQVGLLAFAVAILAGLTVGNSLTVILVRALVALVLGAMVGQVAGWGARSVLRDHLIRKKIVIDQEHLASLKAMQAASEGRPEGPGEAEVSEVG